MPDRQRSATVVLAELAEVRRHLREAPPHHGAGVRESLDARVRSLERELEQVRRSTAHRAQDPD